MAVSASNTVAIVGGAIVGSCVAYFLCELGFAGRIVVVERDPTYRTSATALSAASIRTQFGSPVNIHMSLFGAAFFRSIKGRFGPDADIGFKEHGYLILGTPEVAPSRRTGVDMQRAEGADVVALTPIQAQERFPWLHLDGIGIATFGQRNEGWFDAWSLLTLVRRAARERGVTYVEGVASGIEVHSGRAIGVRMTDGDIIAADWCVNAAGAASAALMRDLQIPLPVAPRKRTVFCLKAPLQAPNFPMLFDTSGAWIRPEGDGFIAGIAPPADDDPDATGDFEPAYDLLEEHLWPSLAHRVPALESLRVERAWAGHYEVNTLDRNGVIGPHDEIGNLLFATGFSGHGVMHAPATGRGIAEQIMYGQYRTIDLSPLSYTRIRTGTPLLETIVY